MGESDGAALNAASVPQGVAQMNPAWPKGKVPSRVIACPLCGAPLPPDTSLLGPHAAYRPDVTGPDSGEAQGEAAASRSCQGSLDGTVPSPGPATSSAASRLYEAADRLVRRSEWAETQSEFFAERNRLAAELARGRESEPTQAMLVLDLLLDVAYHDGSDRDLAVAAEAYTLAGFHDGAIMVSHAATGDTLRRVAEVRKGRPRRLLKHDAQGLLYAVRALIHEGVLDGTEASRRTNRRWIERGGYDRA